MEESKYNKAVKIKNTIDRITYIIDHIDRYTLTIDNKMELANNFMDLYKASYNPMFKISIANCLRDLLNKAKLDFEEL